MSTHVIADFVNEIDRARNVGIEDAANVGEVLIEEGLSQPAPGIGEQGVYSPSVEHGVELIHAVRALRSRGLGVFFTIDAGPQVKVVCLPQDPYGLPNLGDRHKAVASDAVQS